MSELINFEFESIEDVNDALGKIRWNGQLEFGNDTSVDELPRHVGPLVGLATQLGSSEVSLRNAVALAKGHRRLLIVLLEPSDHEDLEEIDEMPEWPATIEEVDWLLADASGGRLGFLNTCVFDIRPLRYRYVQIKQHAMESEKLNDLAYTAFTNMVFRLKPDVIVCCQCDTYNVANPIVRMLCSTMRQAGEVEVREIGGKSTLLVYGFHPSMYLRDKYLQKYIERKGLDADEPEKTADMLQDLLRFTFHVAINELADRKVTGTGLDKLKEALALGRPLAKRPTVTEPLDRINVDLAAIVQRTEVIQIS